MYLKKLNLGELENNKVSVFCMSATSPNDIETAPIYCRISPWTANITYSLKVF